MKLTNSEIDIRLKDRNLVRIGHYVNSITKITWKCKIDGYEWTARPQDILCGGGCPKCANVMPLTNDLVDQRISKENLLLKRLENVKNSRTKILRECNIDGNRWYDSPNNILNCSAKYKYFGCSVCRAKTRQIMFEKLIDELILHKFIQRLSQFVATNKKIRFLCHVCDNQFESNYGDVVYCGSGCPHCKLKGERFVFSVLQEIFGKDKLSKPYPIYKDDKDHRRKFIVDFAVETINGLLLIEFHGSQHYRPTKFSSQTTDEQSLKNFEKQKKRDQLLRNYCYKNNLCFIEIPFWICKNYDKEKLEAFINKQLKLIHEKQLLSKRQ